MTRQQPPVPADGEETVRGLPEVDPDRPSPARVYDYLLGGDHNFAADREVGDRAMLAMPTLRAAIRANRAFLRRVVRHLVTDCGITQFLDLGSGVPTVGNVHEIAQAANPAARVVYVDTDPVAVAHSRRLLAGNPLAVPVLADLRQPDTVLADRRVGGLLDLDRPVAVLMVAVLHFVPDSDRPASIVAAYRDRLAPGSYLALSHAAPDLDFPAEQAGMVADYQRSTGAQFLHRTPAELACWLDGFALCPPGVVLVNQWHPDPGDPPAPILRTYGLLARVPDSDPEG